MSLRWYIRRSDGTEKGPFTTLELEEAHKSGGVSERTLIRREDESQSTPLGEHALFADDLGHARAAAATSERERTPQHDESLAVNQASSDKASARLWAFSLLSALAYVVVKLSVGPSSQAADSELQNANVAAREMGRDLGGLVAPLLVVFIASFWKSNRTERRLVKILGVTSFVLVSLQVLATTSITGVRAYVGKSKAAAAKSSSE